MVPLQNDFLAAAYQMHQRKHKLAVARKRLIHAKAVKQLPSLLGPSMLLRSLTG